MKNPFPRLCLPQPSYPRRKVPLMPAPEKFLSYPRRKVPLMPAPESSSHTLAGAFPPAPVATISPLSLTFCFCLLILCSNIKGGIVMKNFALTLALLSAAVLSPAATPSPARCRHAAGSCRPFPRARCRHAADCLRPGRSCRAACRFLGRFFRGAKPARHDCPCPGTKSP